MLQPGQNLALPQELLHHRGVGFVNDLHGDCFRVVAGTDGFVNHAHPASADAAGKMVAVQFGATVPGGGGSLVGESGGSPGGGVLDRVGRVQQILDGTVEGFVTLAGIGEKGCPAARLRFKSLVKQLLDTVRKGIRVTGWHYVTTPGRISSRARRYAARCRFPWR